MDDSKTIDASPRYSLSGFDIIDTAYAEFGRPIAYADKFEEQRHAKTTELVRRANAYDALIQAVARLIHPMGGDESDVDNARALLDSLKETP